MYGYADNQYMLNSLNRQKEKIEDMINNYKSIPQQAPVNNFINTSQAQTPTKDFVEWRILNENEEVDNLYVGNKTLFINENTMILKDVDGNTKKWSIKQTYPIDKKDEKIDELTKKIEELERKLNNEHTKPNRTAREGKQSNVNVDGNVESKPETASESDTINEQTTTS